MLLDLELNQLKGLSSQTVDDCWDSVMQHWLDGGCKDYPVTWEGLYDLLEDAGYPEVARKLKEAVAPTQTAQPSSPAPTQTIQPSSPAVQEPSQASQEATQQPSQTVQQDSGWPCCML